MWPSHRAKKPTITVAPRPDARKLRKRAPTLRQSTQETDVETNDDDDTPAPTRQYNDDFVVPDDEEEYEVSAGEQEKDSRRSTRAAAGTANKKLKQATLDFTASKKTRPGLRDQMRQTYDEESDFEAYDTDSMDSSPLKKTEKKKPRDKKAAIPEYGLVQWAKDIEEDEDEDEENAVYLAHREICDKCREPPAHIQIIKALKSKGRKKEEEIERLKELGGWVRW